MRPQVAVGKKLVDAVRAVLPPALPAAIGAYTVGAASLWYPGQMETAWLIDASALNRERELVSTHSRWKIRMVTLNACAATAPFYRDLNGCRKGGYGVSVLRSMTKNPQNLVREPHRQLGLDDLLSRSFPGTADQWLLIDCSQPLAWLRSANDTLRKCSVVCVRTSVVTGGAGYAADAFATVDAESASAVAQLHALMASHGFECFQSSGSGQPALAEAVFQRIGVVDQPAPVRDHDMGIEPLTKPSSAALDSKKLETAAMSTHIDALESELRRELELMRQTQESQAALLTAHKKQAWQKQLALTEQKETALRLRLKAETVNAASQAEAAHLRNRLQDETAAFQRKISLLLEETESRQTAWEAEKNALFTANRDQQTAADTVIRRLTEECHEHARQSAEQQHRAEDSERLAEKYLQDVREQEQSIREQDWAAAGVVERSEQPLRQADHGVPRAFGDQGASPAFVTHPCGLLPERFAEEFFSATDKAASLVGLKTVCDSLVPETSVPEICLATATHRDNRYCFAHFENDYIPRIIRETGDFYEAHFLNLLARFHQPGRLIVDGGANLGNHSVFFAGIIRAPVVAFEPQPHNHLLLCANRSLNRLDEMVDVRAKALGSAPGTVALRLSLEDNYGTFTGVPSASERKALPSNEDIANSAAPGFIVEMTTLDAELADQMTDVSIVKLDIEGMELAALQGARQLLRCSRPLVAVECFNKSLYRSIREFLAALDYFPVDATNATPTFIFLNKRNTFHLDALAGHLERLSLAKLAGNPSFQQA